MEKETLKEAAEKRIPTSTKIWDLTETRRSDFIAGAKWQAEKMYSEEEVQNLIKIIEWYDDNSDVRPNWDRVIDGLTMFEWFKQFKKK